MSDRYQVSGWLEGCLQREIERHVINERERIIKLLEAKVSEWIDDERDAWDTSDLIALIKGEK